MSGNEDTLLGQLGGWIGTADAVVVACLWVGGRLVVADGDGGVAWIDPAAPTLAPLAAHAGAILCAQPTPDGRAVITGGDDGRLMRLTASAEAEELACFPGRWIEHLCLSVPLGLGVAAVGKEAIVFDLRSGATLRRFAHPSTIGGLALDPKGRRVAVSHYGGVSLWWLGVDGGNVRPLVWAGSHLETTWSPNGRFIVTAMQENTLHGWRIDDGADMRMSGYATKARAFAWSAKGRWLATSGALQAICWPFGSTDGPMGKSSLQRGVHGAQGASAGTPALVTQVAFHPREDILAAGYDDGCVELVHLADGRAMVAVAPGDGAITSIAWSGDGEALACGSEDGRIALVSFRAASKR